MFVVQCAKNCGTFLPANGNKPVLKTCGKSHCAEDAWMALAVKHGVSDFFEW